MEKNKHPHSLYLAIFILILFTGVCKAQTQQSPVNLNYAIAEMNWTEQEYNDYLLHKDDKPLLDTCNLKAFNQVNNIITPKGNVVIPCKPHVRITPLIPFNIIKEEDHENTTK